MIVNVVMAKSNSNTKEYSGTIVTLRVECAYMKYKIVCVEFDDASSFRVRGGKPSTKTAYEPLSNLCGIVTLQNPIVPLVPVTLKLITLPAKLNLKSEIVELHIAVMGSGIFSSITMKSENNPMRGLLS